MLILPRPLNVDAETLTTTALAASVRITKTKGVIEPLSDEVYLGALKKRYMFAVHDDLYAAILYEHVIMGNVIGHIHHISESGAAGPFDAKPQSDAVTTLCDVCIDLPGG